MAVTGAVAAAVQILFLREYLSVFSGNELVIGLIFGLWLLATAAGSRIGGRADFSGAPGFAFVWSISIVAGFLMVRGVRLLYHPGELISSWHIPVIVVLTQSAAAFSGGLAFGRLSRAVDGGKLYWAESAGAAAGFLGVFLCSMARFRNGTILAGTLMVLAMAAYGPAMLAPALERRRALLYCGASLFLIGGLLAVDPASVRWKYPFTIDKVFSGYEGEIALSEAGGGGSLTFLNNTVYRADMPLPSIEQAVHVPASLHRGPLHRALVIGNPGYLRELGKYGGLRVICLETEPALAVDGCTCGAIETLKPDERFDLTLLGAGLPVTTGAGRFYTTTFFLKMRRMAGDSGIVSFTLPLSENFLSPQEQRLKDILMTTLGRDFKHTLVVPGEGYTFIASNQPLPWPAWPRVPTRYLAACTLASLTPERLGQAQKVIDSGWVSTIDRPVLLLETERQWLRLFGMPLIVPAGVLLIFLAVAMIVSPRTGTALSVGTSGFAAGAYSIALLLVFQGTFGVLYSRVALLMLALAVGFMIGGRMNKFPFSDLLIGAYAVVTLLVLVGVRSPPLFLFLMLHAGMGFLAGAQFVSRRPSSWSGLYAADLAGGVFGMALASTVFVPLLGVTGLAALLGMVKVVPALVAVRIRR